MTMSTTMPSFHLESNPENPKINTKLYQKFGITLSDKPIDYIIQTCAKDAAENDEARKYRSVIWSNGKLVCFSPPKSIPLEQFKQKYPDPSKTILSEIGEGTMINLFYDFSINSWEISTKNAIGGNYWYFSDPQTPNITFREMFLDALCASHSDLNINNIINNQDFIPSYCYSFVLQHPANHFVLNITKPYLYLIAIYKIDGNTATQVSNHPIWERLLRGLNDLSEEKKNDLNIYRPETIRINSYNEIDGWLDVTPTGFMLIHQETGERVKIEHPTYLYSKNLRGNNPKIQYQYLCLLRIGKINEFLQYFPIYTEEFQRCSQLFHSFVTNIHNIYFKYYVKKQRDTEYNKNMMYFVNRIHHEVFLAQRQIVTKQVVSGWLLETIEPHAIWYHIHIV